MEMLRWVQLACFAWVAWLPVSQTLILYPALAALAGCSVLLWWRDRAALPRDLVIASAVYVAFVVAWAAFAFARDNPGAVHQTVLWLGVPLIWMPWAMSLRGPQVRRTLLTIVGVGAVTAVTVIVLAIEALGGPTLPTAFKDLQQMWFTVTTDGQIELAYLGLSSLVAMAAFVLAAAFVPGPDSWLPSRRVLVVVAALTFIAGVASGRRGLAVVVLLAPLLAVGYSLVVARKRTDVTLGRYARGLVLSAVALGVLMVSPLGTNLNALVGLPAGITIGSDDGRTSGPKPDGGLAPVDANADDDSARVDQVAELVTEWKTAPVLGQGFGAVLDSGYERSEDRPWLFETQPLQILMNIGLLGYLVLLVVSGLVLRVVLRAHRTGRHRPTLIASVITCLCMLVADITNPYLQAPGHGWAVFLVIGVCLALLTDREPDPVVDAV